MRNRLPLAAVVAGTAVLLIHPLSAQETGGVSASLTFDQKFESGSNLGLRIPDEGDTSLSSTRLGFDLSSETRLQRFDFSAGGILRLGDIPERSRATEGFGDPRVSLGYARDTGNTDFDIFASYRQRDISYIQPFEDFSNGEGGVDLPPDFEELSGSGQRNSYRFATNFETGKNETVGFLADASIDNLDYKKTTSSSLNDTMRTRAGIAAILRPTPTTTGQVRFSYYRFEENNALNTDRETRSVVFSAISEISEDAVLNASFGYEEIVTDQAIGTDTEAGPIGELGYEQALRNGIAFASLASTRDQNGQRYTVRAGRNLDLARGELGGSIGTTVLDGTSPEFIGSLDFLQQLPRSTIRLNLNRDVRTDSQDEERLSTRMGFRYDHQVNEISSFGLNFGFSFFEANGLSNQVDRTALSVTYYHEVTNDWTLRAGLSHQIRDEDTVGRAESTSVFVGLGRTFDLLR